MHIMYVALLPHEVSHGSGMTDAKFQEVVRQKREILVERRPDHHV
jgi:hypothetical protein